MKWLELLSSNFLYTTSDSPVKVDSLIPNPWHSKRIPSAEILSPSSNNTKSPTTISLLSITNFLPSRITFTFKADKVF